MLDMSNVRTHINPGMSVIRTGTVPLPHRLLPVAGDDRDRSQGDAMDGSADRADWAASGLVCIRDADLPDARGIARVHIDSWRATYPGLLPESYLVNMSEAALTPRWARAILADQIALRKTPRIGRGTLVVVPQPDALVTGDAVRPARNAARNGRRRLSPTDSPVKAFASFGEPSARLENFTGGEIFTLYVQSDEQGQGIGRRLMAEMAKRLIHAGHQHAMLWCLRDNPSRWFYERIGGQPMAERTIRFAGSNLIEIAYGWDDLVSLSRVE